MPRHLRNQGKEHGRTLVDSDPTDGTEKSSANWINTTFCTGVLVSPYPNQEGNKLMFLSEWREYPSAPCLAGKKKIWWHLASRYCWNHARPWHASELASFLIRLKTYQHPVFTVYITILSLGRTTQLPVAGWTASIELQTLWKKAAVAYFKELPQN